MQQTCTLVDGERIRDSALLPIAKAAQVLGEADMLTERWGGLEPG